jgi:predicted transcriptional regulator
MADFVRAWKTIKSQRSARISFATPELLWKVLTAKRWELLKVLCGAGPISIREAARRVGRDVKAVHSDISALLNVGVLDRAASYGTVTEPDEQSVAIYRELGDQRGLALCHDQDSGGER